MMLQSANRCVVANNVVLDNSYGDAGNNDGIKIYASSNNVIIGNVIADTQNQQRYGIVLDAAATENSIENNYTKDNLTACLRINNANCVRNMITNNQFDEGNISDIGGAHNCRAWLNYDPSANVFIATINAPAVVGGGGGALP